MLRFVDRPLGSLLLKAAGANLFIATFAAAILILRSESPSAAEFFHVYAVSLIYSFCCGGLAWASICFAERRFRRFPRGVRILVVTLLCVLSGAIGQFIGSAICLLTNIDGRGASSVTFSRTLLADWVYAPILALIAACFGLLLYACDMLLRNLEAAATRLKDKELREERLLKLRAEAELKALQARVNPPFLFNTLNTIASLISEEPEKAEEMTEKLSTLFRYALSADREGHVRLAQELHILREYLDIEQVRLGEKLRYLIDLEPGLDHLQIPPLLLQPLVENSVQCAIARREEGGSIEVRVRRLGERCLLEVVDDGPEFSGEPADSALHNIRQRLAATYGAEHRFSILRLNGKTAVQIEIPLQKDSSQSLFQLQSFPFYSDKVH